MLPPIIFLLFLLHPSSTTITQICTTHCLCDHHTLTVTCASPSHTLPLIIRLPDWAEQLHIENFNLTRLPHFTFHRQLRIFRVNHCRVRELLPLDLINLPALETVHLAHNEIEEVPEEFLHPLGQLRILNLAHNRIRRIDGGEESNRVLEQLVLDGNPLEGAGGGGLIRVRQLHLGDANVEEINGSHLIFKPSPSCPSQIVTVCRSLSLTPSLLLNLQVLDLFSNTNLQIHPSSLPLLTNLTTLNLSGATLSPDVFQQLISTPSNLRHLDLSNCSIPQLLAPLPASVHFIQQINSATHHHPTRGRWSLRCGPHLEWLDISLIGFDQLQLDNCQSLKWFFSQGNNLQEIQLEGANELKSLYLDGNRLTQWPITSGGGSLEILSISNNQLEEISSVEVGHLEVLDASNNEIDSFVIGAGGGGGEMLRSLNLSGNSLVLFLNVTLPSLRALDLSFNSHLLTVISPFSSFPLLQHLHLAGDTSLSSSSFGWIDATRTPELVELDVRNGSLTQMPDLHSLTSLRILNLEGNRLAEIDRGRVPSATGGAPLEINLRRNNISRLPDELLAAVVEGGWDVHMGRNPFICDCSLAEVATILLHKMEDPNEYYCLMARDGSVNHPLHTYLEEECGEGKMSADANEYATPIDNRDMLIPLAAILVIAALLLLVLKQQRGSHSNTCTRFAYRLIPTRSSNDDGPTDV